LNFRSKNGRFELPEILTAVQTLTNDNANTYLGEHLVIIHPAVAEQSRQKKNKRSK